MKTTRFMAALYLCLIGLACAQEEPGTRLYGFKEDSVFTQFSCVGLSHLILSYPRAATDTSQLPAPDFQIEIGQGLLNQFAIPRIFHTVLDKFEDRALPIQSLQSKRYNLADYIVDQSWLKINGHLQFYLWNIRLHKARIVPPSNSDGYDLDTDKVTVEQDAFGGHLVDQRVKGPLTAALERTLNLKHDAQPSENFDVPPSSAYVNQSSVVFIKKDRVRVALKGLNLVLTSSYQIASEDSLVGHVIPESEIWIRVTNAAVFFDVDLTEANGTRGPALSVPSKPDVYLNKLDYRIANTRVDKWVNILSAPLQKVISDFAEVVVANAIRDELANLGEIIQAAIEAQILASLQGALSERNLGASEWPRLALEDMRWSVSNYRIMAKGFIRHIPAEERALMASRWRNWEGETQNQNAVETCKLDLVNSLDLNKEYHDRKASAPSNSLLSVSYPLLRYFLKMYSARRYRNHVIS